MKVRKIVSSALALGVGLAMSVGGAAMADPGPGNITGDVGSITVHKYSGEPVVDAEGDPLANDGSEVDSTDIDNPALKDVQFTLYKVVGLDVKDPAQWPDITDLNDWIVAKNETGSWSVASGGKIGTGDAYTVTQVATGGASGITGANPQKTDADGLVKWGVDDTSNLPVGVYFIQETGAPANVAEHTQPFLVTVPMAHNSDNTWIYDVNVYPKNALVDVTKQATDIGPEGIGKTVPWTVTSKVPTVQRDFESFMLRDVLDSRLAYVDGSTVIELDGTALKAPGEGVTDNDYTVAYDTGTNAVLITLTEAGLSKISQTANQGKDLVWTFDTTVIQTGTDGIIRNKADVMVNNPDGDWATDSTPSNEVSSNWGKVEILKYGSEDTSKVLTGAKFQVFGSAADAEACQAAVVAAKGTLATCDDLTYDTDKKIAAISVTRDASGNAITEQNVFITGDDGKVVIPGLFVGINDDVNSSKATNYWLVEITPPAGYVNAATVYELKVQAGTDVLVTTQDVPNAQEPPTTLPQTGAIVSMALKIGAIALALGAIALVVANRKKAANNA